ncbi:hypothetical protein BU23DRAFT_662157 [Bimuria novae-zelandiae CBS 107.79]|uniref:Uncharacterized protein n=1 Tax=Bimuria novae-zelandiae CBS 107.79 TaxID=1447943 RepID=A0A6A5US27_9PLEO|nr:hypothetical protein BU23DRAFT_662157 [Bimuria novae-zelandiae CBS 107.79]
MAKTAKYHPLTKRSTAWALTQVSRQLRSELLPLVLPERVPQVALCELAEFLQDFYHGPTAEKSLPSVEDQNHPDGNVKQLHRHGYIKVWASRAGVHKRILSNGVALLPILRALAKCESLKVSFHKWCIWNWELAIIQSLHETWTHWCNDIPKLGFLDMHLRTEYGNNTGYPRNRLSSSITLNCKATAHTSEKKRVVDLARWVYKSGVRTLHQRVKGLTILFVTPKTNRGQASEVKLSVFASSMKLEWWSRGSYCVARLVDNDTTETGFSVVKKDVIGKDVLRL